MFSFFVTLARLASSFLHGLRDPEFRAILFILAGLLVSGTVFYGSVEGWSVVDAFYFSVMTLSTVGHGDPHPPTDLSKIFTVAYLLVGVGVFVSLIVKMTAQTNRNHRHRYDRGGPS